MFIPLVLLVLTSFGLLGNIHGEPWPRETHGRRYYTVRLSPGTSDKAARVVAQKLGARFEGRVGELERYYEMSVPHDPVDPFSLVKRHVDDNDQDDAIIAQFHRLLGQSQALHKRDPLAMAFQAVDKITRQVPLRRLYKRGVIAVDHLRPEIPEDTAEERQALENALRIHDPGFEQQWHLANWMQRGADLNVTGVWKEGITGKNVSVAILDDGLDMDNEDLTANFFPEGSWDFNDHTSLPKPRLDDDTHGTRCAGEIAAARNDVCGVGVAYDAKVAGIRILSGNLTVEDEARALNYKYQENDIYSCSWGPPDFGQVVEAPPDIVLDAIKNGAEQGRHGKGTVYVFATGNGGIYDDNCNFDGYTNSIYTISIGAIDIYGRHPSYSERCSAQLAVTYSSGEGYYIHTSDVGTSACTYTHGGTSAAAPLAAGVFALVLSVRPDLTWRDIQWLCVGSAVPLTLDDADWVRLPSGRLYNHNFGYGKLDAYAMVDRARTWINVGPQTHLDFASPMLSQPIPQLTPGSGKEGAFKSVSQVPVDTVQQARLIRLEHVTVTVTIEHERRGDLEILLESPQGVVSQLGTPRKYDESLDGLMDWTFMSVKHWDESPIGNWTLWVIDDRHPEYTGLLVNWTLTLWGEEQHQHERSASEPNMDMLAYGQNSRPHDTYILRPDQTSMEDLSPQHAVHAYNHNTANGPSNQLVFAYLCVFIFIAVGGGSVVYGIHQRRSTKDEGAFEFDMLSHQDHSEHAPQNAES